MIVVMPRRSLSYESLQRGVDRRLRGAFAVLSLVGACVAPPGRSSSPVAAPLHFTFAVDTLRSTRVAPGVTYDHVWSPTGPWAIHLLRVDRDSCWQLAAAKGGDAAIGREPTSALVRELARHERVVAGVNADFFLFSPPGVPRGAHVQEGRVITGPGDRPVIAADSSGTLFIGRLDVTGRVMAQGNVIPLEGWNRAVPRGLAFVDRAWGAASDTGSGSVEVVVAGAPLRVVTTDTAPAGVPIPIEGGVLVAGRDADAAARRTLLGLRPGDTVSVQRAITRPHLRTVVGGWPVIVRDSTVTPAADSAGASFAPVRHPRTAVGIAHGGRELILVVVDGRQKPYSDGMTLRELAELFRSLGATQALNLDGGGSSTFVLADSVAPGGVRILNRPSDKVERAVGNALVVVRGCQVRPGDR
jgi:exopolysaccharide biosynthesis protein